MKVVILAGGYGTRISEESKFKPKPMIEIGGMPILWHIMKEYSYYGFNDFVICAGYKQHMIKEWFADYFLHTSDVTFDFTQGNEMIVHDQHAEPWRVTVVDTGLNTMTGGRIKRVQKYIGNETFMMTYGDGVCDVNIAELVKFYKQHGKLATLTAVVQEQQKGVLDIGQDNSVQAFREKSVNDGAIINAGYMVLEPEVFDTISGDDTIFEQAPLRELAAKGQLMSYVHRGFWQCMDTEREKSMLEKMWASGCAPWEVGLEGKMTSVIGDIRDFASLKAAFDAAQPEIVLHLAAQPIVRDSYKNPRYTYETNVMGTVNLLECVRTAQTPPRSVLNVTTDKVYQNNEWCWGYRENEPLDGFDPYSNSKSCSELVTHSYKNSFFADGSVAISTARAGNVIGGGDFANDRIIPDCVRAMAKGESIGVRNPYSTRPYQHVLEPLAAYLLIAQRQYEDNRYAGYYNVGPDDCDCVTTGTLVDLFCQAWGDGTTWENRAEANAPHEANFLKLDCSKLKSTFGWKPRWHMAECMQKTVAFSKVWLSGGDIPAEMDKEIKEFLSE